MGPFSGSRAASAKAARQLSDLTLADSKKAAAASGPALVARPAGFDPAKAFVKDLTTKLDNR